MSPEKHAHIFDEEACLPKSRFLSRVEGKKKIFLRFISRFSQITDLG